MSVDAFNNWRRNSSIVLFLSGGCYLILRHVGRGREKGIKQRGIFQKSHRIQKNLSEIVACTLATKTTQRATVTCHKSASPSPREALHFGKTISWPRVFIQLKVEFTCSRYVALGLCWLNCSTTVTHMRQHDVFKNLWIENPEDNVIK